MEKLYRKRTDDEESIRLFIAAQPRLPDERLSGQ